jgi:signal transduction histidine kinase
MKIEDNGKQLKKSIPTSGLGLSNIKERAKQIQGVLNISTDQGFIINLKAPLPKQDKSFV